MKTEKALSLVITISIGSLCHAQISEPQGVLLYEDTISMDPLNEWITIPSPDENIWQAGRTNKSFLDSSLSEKAVMMTDTIDSYPALMDDYFLISIPQTENFYSWPEGILSFYHRFQTDSLLDGGYIEISYDGGESWQNIIYDDIHINNVFTGLYSTSDTIKDGIPAFTGSTSDWKYTEFHWIWVGLTKSSTSELEGRPILKFRFVSDDVDTGKDGWLIDQLVFRGYDFSGAVAEQPLNTIDVYPNPFTEFLHISSSKGRGKSKFRLYGSDGKLQLQSELSEEITINASVLSTGLYYYAIFKDNQLVETGKLIKE
ncbi:MAG: T9SS type A sorting domain-containing protein [Bacteroidota bacterium]